MLDSSQRNYSSALGAMTTLFFMLGSITSLNDILIPHLKAIFLLNYAEAMLVQFCFRLAYLLISLPAGRIVGKLGYKKGIVIGLATAGAGCLAFYPAASLETYAIFLIALFILASGFTFLQVSANPYVSILGKPETASSRLNLTQAFDSLGTTVAPYLGSLLILSFAVKSGQELQKLAPDQLNLYKLAEARSVQVPYLGLAALLFIIAIIFSVLKLPNVKGGQSMPSGNDGKSYDEIHKSAWGYKHLYLGALGIFVYVGAEASIGSFLVNYFGSHDVLSMPALVAGKFVAFYWGGAMIGRFIGSGLQRKIKPSKMLAFNALVAALLVVTSMLTFGYLAMWTILLVGLFNSIMFPTIFTLAINGLGKHTSQGSGILCMAIVGGAVVPVLQGFLADQIGIHHAFLIPVICYLYIIFYGLKGYIPSFQTQSVKM
ncbi:MAG: sugar MFS transporter [Bacteroidetes bacterium]|nr:sugar MFS transporter [Bacteroidota bacterium]